jgi:hypothetical protein|mmetsp:Transcript_1474/g.1558  ORF Transcript_1474/g.1558 Transcript_1474/m.1558 type:complete len:239 (-) Transcript_1474:349-1065(-)|eukprot:gene1028-1090_t
MGGAASSPTNPEKNPNPTGAAGSNKKDEISKEAINTPPAETSKRIETKPKVSEDAEEVNYKAIHSAFRWNKPPEEIEPLLTSVQAINAPDPNNGNTPIHIAAQNGHNELVKLLIRKKADLNAKNLKGNTGLHMSIGYDYYETSMLLINNGADLEVLNDSGVPAKFGLEGNKALGIAALVNAKNPSEVLQAFQLCETVIDKLDRVNFAQAGLKAKKTLGGAWSADLQEQFKEMTSRLSQ